MFVDIPQEDLNWRELYRLCISAVTPRPIALVSSVAPDGRRNLAPFSFFNMVSANPPVLMFSCGMKRTGAPKDTLINVEARREFTVAIVDAPLARRMVDCAADLPYGDSEFEFSGLTPAPARHVAADRIAEAPVNFECRLRQIVPLGDGPGSARVVFGDILGVHVADGLLLPDRSAIDPHRLQSVGRLGGAWYCNVTAPYELKIPDPPAGG